MARPRWSPAVATVATVVAERLRRLGRRAGARVGVLAVLVAAAHGAPSPATAAPVNHATVVVDTGQGVITRTIEFTSSSVTGLQALDLAGADPVVWSYSGQGGAVCRLFGVGRDAGPGCLGGEGGDARYWAYYQATNGATKFGYSPVGAGSTSVRDGDVEGWRFGLGGAPPFPAATPPSSAVPVTDPPASAPPGPAVTAGGSGGGGAAVLGDGSPERTAPTAAPTASTLPGTGGASAARREGGDRGTAVLASGRRELGSAVGADSGTGSDGPTSLLLFGVLLAALVVAIVLVRRRRRPAR